MKILIILIATWIVGITDYSFPENLPRIELVSEMKAEDAVGAYENNTIYLLNTWDINDTESLETLAHEITHWLQDKNNNNKKRCELEAEAYAIQDSIVKMLNRKPEVSISRLIATTCYIRKR